jgi:hypothetical protein
MQIDIVSFALVSASVVFGIAADFNYFLELRKPGHTPPNRWSWLIWCISTYIEVATFNDVSEDGLKVLPLATTPVACTVLLVYVWTLKEDRWETRLDALIDIFSVIACFGAMLMWLRYGEGLWAHILMISAIPISYLPILKSVPEKTNRSDGRPWMLWAGMDSCNFFLNLHRLDDVWEVPYVAIELVCHTGMWALISHRSR